ncbi:MAG: rod shape-determining protein MreD [Waddliaceae bacterium]
MNLQQKNLPMTFLSMLVLTLLMPALAPGVPISCFIPFLVIAMYKKPQISCLWYSLLCGLILDLLSSRIPLGICATNFTASTWVLYRQKQNFFADNLATLPLVTALFSIISTFFQFVLLSLCEKTLFFHQSLQGFFMVPFLNATFSFAYFILPFVLFGKPMRKGSDYFLHNH